MHRTAVISDDGKYRYTLERDWEEGSSRCVFIMLNPSTADDRVDDPTVRRCIAYAKRFGCYGLTILNLFAYRSTDPKALLKVKNPIGPANNEWLEAAFQVLEKSIVIFAWGAGANKYQDRVKEVEMLAEANGISPSVLGLTKRGYPIHPLYQPKDAQLKRWRFSFVLRD